MRGSFETPLSHLFVERASPAVHMGELVLFVGALAATAALLFGRPLLIEHADLGAFAAALLLAVYAGSLALLDLSQRLGGGDLHAKFQRGETMVSALWAVVALVILVTGLVRGVREIRWAGLALLALSLAKRARELVLGLPGIVYLHWSERIRQRRHTSGVPLGR